MDIDPIYKRFRDLQAENGRLRAALDKAVKELEAVNRMPMMGGCYTEDLIRWRSLMSS